MKQNGVSQRFAIVILDTDADALRGCNDGQEREETGCHGSLHYLRGHRRGGPPAGSLQLSSLILV